MIECDHDRRKPADGIAAHCFNILIETAEHIARLREAHPDLEIVEQGSSYKFCLLAEGKVDYYVRTTHTYEWDTAAGELILVCRSKHCKI